MESKIFNYIFPVCPCGYYGDPFRQCNYPPSLVARYQRRISRPFLDWADFFLDVPHIDYEKLADDRLAEKSEQVRAMFEAAHAIQQERFKRTDLHSNFDMKPGEVREFCQVEEAAQSLLTSATKQLHLSAHAFHRVLKLARTIANLESAALIKAHHLAEAIQYRPRRTI